MMQRRWLAYGYRQIRIQLRGAGWQVGEASFGCYVKANTGTDVEYPASLIDLTGCVASHPWKGCYISRVYDRHAVSGRIIGFLHSEGVPRQKVVRAKTVRLPVAYS